MRLSLLFLIICFSIASLESKKSRKLKNFGVHRREVTDKSKSTGPCDNGKKCQNGGKSKVLKRILVEIIGLK